MGTIDAGVAVLMLASTGSAGVTSRKLDIASPPLVTDLLDRCTSLFERNGVHRAVKDTEEAGLAILQVGDNRFAVRLGLGNNVGWTRIDANATRNANYRLDIELDEHTNSIII